MKMLFKEIVFEFGFFNFERYIKGLRWMPRNK
jgi:hypothetical protein